MAFGVSQADVQTVVDELMLLPEGLIDLMIEDELKIDIGHSLSQELVPEGFDEDASVWTPGVCGGDRIVLATKLFEGRKLGPGSILHEIGHWLADEIGIPKGFEDAYKKDLAAGNVSPPWDTGRNDNYYHPDKNPDEYLVEAFAEAFLLAYTNCGNHFFRQWPHMVGLIRRLARQGRLW